MGLLSTIGAASARAYGFTRSAIAAAVDAYFNRVTLLLPGNGTNGAQNNTFLDSSSNNFTITRNGNTTQGTFSPFSQTGWSNYFNGSSSIQFPSNAALSPGTGDFTLEFWYFGASDAGPLFVTTTSGALYVGSLPGGVFGLRAYAVANICSTSTFPTSNQWTHIAITRSGTTCRLFYNGALQQTSTSSQDFVQGTSYIATDASGAFATGYISNFRIVKGTAVYTSAFTPSTTPLTAITNTSLLTCQSNRFIDNSTNAFAITVNGTPSVQAFSPFAPTAAYSAATNGGAAYFDGTGDYLSVADNAAFNLGTNDWTIESWFYATAYSADYPRLWGQSTGGATGNNSVGLFFQTQGDGSVINLRWGTTSNQTNDSGAITINATKNQWHHIAVVRDGNTMRLYFNGVQKYSTSVTGVTFYDSSAVFAIGANSSGGELWQGYISDVRVVNGTCLYTGGTTFTLPTAPLTAVTNTKLLASCTNAGIRDATGKNVLETVGNAQISTTQSKFGGSSMYFDGTGDRLTTRFIPIQDLSGGDWTIEFWMNFGSSVPTTFRSIAGASNGGGAVPKWVIIANANTSYTYQANRLMFATYNGADRQLNVGFTWATNTWYHIAIVQNGGTTTLYIDGVSQGTMAYNIGSGITAGVIIGADGEGYSEFTGYIDDLRITKGYARYTTTFTPPTAAFAVQ